MNRFYFSVSRQDWENRNSPGTIGYKIFEMLPKYGTVKQTKALYSGDSSVNKIGFISAIDTNLELWMLRALKLDNIGIDFFCALG